MAITLHFRFGAHQIALLRLCTFHIFHKIITLQTTQEWLLRMIKMMVNFLLHFELFIIAICDEYGPEKTTGVS